MEILSLRHAYPEKAGFYIERKSGHPAYTFLHFHNSVEIRIGESLLKTDPHAVVLYRPFMPQFFRSPTPLLHDWMHFSGDADTLLQEAELPLDTVFYPSGNGFITDMIGQMETEFYGSRSFRDRLLNLKAEELLLKLGRSLHEEQTEEIVQQTKDQFRYLRGKLFSNLGRNWTISEMAREVHLSEARFYSIYKNIYGISPNADLIHARLEAAQNMLLFSGKKVGQIASELGYHNVTHFIRQFRDRYGVPPSSYRKNFHDQLPDENLSRPECN